MGSCGSSSKKVNTNKTENVKPRPKTGKAEAQRLEVISKFDKMFDSDFSKRTLKRTLGINSLNDIRDKSFDKDRGQFRGWVTLDVGKLKEHQKLSLKKYLQKADLKFEESGTWILHIYK